MQNWVSEAKLFNGSVSVHIPSHIHCNSGSEQMQSGRNKSVEGFNLNLDCLELFVYIFSWLIATPLLQIACRKQRLRYLNKKKKKGLMNEKLKYLNWTWTWLACLFVFCRFAGKKKCPKPVKGLCHCRRLHCTVTAWRCHSWPAAFYK